MPQNPILIPADSFLDIKSAIASTLDEVHDFTLTPSSRTYAILTNLNCVLMLLAKAEEAGREVVKPVSTLPTAESTEHAELAELGMQRRLAKNQANRESRLRVKARNDARKADKAKKTAPMQLGTQLTLLPA